VNEYNKVTNHSQHAGSRLTHITPRYVS